MGKYRRNVETLKRMVATVSPERREKAILAFIWRVLDDKEASPRDKLARIQAVREAMLTVQGG